ncbi:MAG: hypothetical protein ACRD2C_17685 [Acidimicrobiales bacterium]
MTAHRVVVERDGQGWKVRVDDFSSVGALLARDLADVEPRCRKLISELSGEGLDDIHLEIELRLPPVVQDRLDVIRQHCVDVEAEYEAAIAELIELGLSLSDTGRVLRPFRWSPRPLVVTNAEVAEHGLANYPNAVGLEWDDHGHCRTLKCRAHVEATRAEYQELPPDGENALVYARDGFACDFCDEVDQ